MELGTFGAILTFSIELEGRAARFYEEAAAREGIPELLAELSRGSAKRERRLLRARQELVSEMILESITGLDGDAYGLPLDPATGVSEVLTQGQAIEATVARYYGDAAQKMPIREVVRLFNRLAQENDRRRAKIEAAMRDLGG